MTSEDGLLDLLNLTEWLNRHLPQLGQGALHAERLTGGMTNAVYAIDRGGLRMVLRRPPAALRPDSEKILEREARVLGALADTPVPAPRLQAFCDDRSVTNALFYVMDFVEGWLGWPSAGAVAQAPPPFDRRGPNREALAFALVDGIAALANVDYRAVGLDGFGKPDGFLERQVDRWRGQLASYEDSENYEGRSIPGLDYAMDWLKANTPPMSAAGILHGDYSFANALFVNTPPARLAAMIDWELSTIGDPLLDLGWVMYGFRGRKEKTPPSGYFEAADFPFREDLAEYYAELTGRSLEHITYYMVLAQVKLATLMERHVARALNGRQSTALGESSDAFVRRLALKAEEMARSCA